MELVEPMGAMGGSEGGFNGGFGKRWRVGGRERRQVSGRGGEAGVGGEAR